MSADSEKKALAMALWGCDALPLPDSEQRTLERLHAKGLRMSPLDVTYDQARGVLDAVDNFIRNRSPEHTGPSCRPEARNFKVPSDRWVIAGAQDHCSLCLMNRALAHLAGEDREQQL